VPALAGTPPPAKSLKSLFASFSSEKEALAYLPALKLPDYRPGR
jgi:hypothetical protein